MKEQKRYLIFVPVEKKDHFKHLKMPLDTLKEQKSTKLINFGLNSRFSARHSDEISGLLFSFLVPERV